MPNTEQIYNTVIQQSQENVKALSEKLKALDKLYQDIIKLKDDNSKLPKIFDDKFNEISELSRNYTNNLGKSAKIYLDGNNTLFTSKISELSSKIKDIEREISRLVETDFKSLFKILQNAFIEQARTDIKSELSKIDPKITDFQERIKEMKTEISRLVKTDFINLFKNLQNAFIEQARKDIKVELNKIDSKITNFQQRINEFKTEIERLENIDLEKHLEKHFDKLQKTLADIFGAINSLNISFTTVIQTLNNIVQSVGSIQTKIDDNHNDTKQSIKIFRDNTTNHLNEQDIEITKNRKLFENKMKLLTEQNKLLKKEVKTNRLIIFVGFGLVIITLIYNILQT